MSQSRALVYPELTGALEKLGLKRLTLDGEIVVVDEKGFPSFQALQHLGNEKAMRRRLLYYVFDLLNFEGRDTTRLTIEQRKELLKVAVEDAPGSIRMLQAFETDPETALEKMREHGLEGLLCKRAGSIYEQGLRSGAWLKYRIGWEQEFVIGGYKHPEGVRGVIESLLIGYYERGKLMYAGKVKNGFPEAELLKAFRRIARPSCPFVNLPIGSSGRWGFGLDTEEMKRCLWVQPRLVCQVQFAEWTRGGLLRHTSFKGMRLDKDAREVSRERTT